MADDPETESARNIQLDYRRPESRPSLAEVRRVLIRKILAWGFVVMAVMVLLISLTLAPSTDRRETMKAKCFSTLSNIAAAIITYANTHNGAYPATMEELLSSSGMTPRIMICPASNDTPIADLSPAQLATLSTGGHLSYIYLGKGVTSTSPDDTVLVYEPLANHQNRGMNVLFNDYHVAFLKPAEGRQLIASIVPGQPTIWPPRVKK